MLTKSQSSSHKISSATYLILMPNPIRSNTESNFKSAQDTILSTPLRSQKLNPHTMTYPAYTHSPAQPTKTGAISPRYQAPHIWAESAPHSLQVCQARARFQLLGFVVEDSAAAAAVVLVGPEKGTLACESSS